MRTGFISYLTYLKQELKKLIGQWKRYSTETFKYFKIHQQEGRLPHNHGFKQISLKLLNNQASKIPNEKNESMVNRYWLIFNSYVNIGDKEVVRLLTITHELYTKMLPDQKFKIKNMNFWYIRKVQVPFLFKLNIKIFCSKKIADS